MGKSSILFFYSRGKYTCRW